MIQSNFHLLMLRLTHNNIDSAYVYPFVMEARIVCLFEDVFSTEVSWREADGKGKPISDGYIISNCR